MPESQGERLERLAPLVRHDVGCARYGEYGTHLLTTHCGCSRSEVINAIAAGAKPSPIELELTRDGAEIRAQVKVIGDQRDETVIDLLLMPGDDYEHERYTPQVKA